MIRRWVLLLALLVLPAQLDAASLYVNNSGSPACNDATAKASNSAGSPWCTIHRAVKGATFGGGTSSSEAAAAGDTVYVTCGTYTAVASDTQRYIGLQTVNSGTAGNPIRIQSADNSRDCIRVTPQTAAQGGSVIGAGDTDYIEWSGFDLNETDWPRWVGTCPDPCTANQNGLVLFYSTATFKTNNSRPILGGLVENSRLVAESETGRDGDNYTAIRIDDANATIRNNRVDNVGAVVAGSHNASCFSSYRGHQLVIENNWMTDCGAGIYLKNHSDLANGCGQHLVRKNLIERVAYGIYLLQNSNGCSGSPVIISQNIVNDALNSCYMINGLGGGSIAQDPVHTKFLNNLTYNCDEACFELNVGLNTAAGNLIQNNICAGSANAVLADGGATSSDLDSTKLNYVRNAYSVSGTFASWSGIGTITFANWQSVRTMDVNGTDSGVTFVNAAGGDFHNGGGSSALNLGRAIHGIGGADNTTINAGPYIVGTEDIGLTDVGGGESGSTAPSGGKGRMRMRGKDPVASALNPASVTRAVVTGWPRRVGPELRSAPARSSVAAGLRALGGHTGLAGGCHSHRGASCGTPMGARDGLPATATGRSTRRARVRAQWPVRRGSTRGQQQRQPRSQTWRAPSSGGLTTTGSESGQ